MCFSYCFSHLVLVSLLCIELTFELPDNANQCFYEEVKTGVDCVIEFQVVTGGQYDVDVVLEDPVEIFSGTYKVCFSNEFSTFSHKVVYMDWQFGDSEHANGRPTPRVGTMNQLDSSSANIGDKLRIVDDYQTHHRLREATSRKRAEDLNERIFIWSLGQTAIVVLLGIGQVLLLRSFFSDKRQSY
uniref:GOLD domain-containing protein n=1 Tax=Ditylenchus dipsaci TaxID=166011 RepID=A0A915E6Q0_9BILA